MPKPVIFYLRIGFSVLKKIPFLGVLALALLLQGMKEFYPFSHYPMFSVLTPTVEFYYLTNGKGEVIPQNTYFGFSTSWTRKMLNSMLAKLSGGDNIDNASKAEVTAAGLEMLHYLTKSAKPEYEERVKTEGLQLRQIFIHNTNGHLERRDTFIAEIPARP